MAVNSRQVAKAFTTFYGPAQAVRQAYGMAALSRPFSDRAVFFDMVARTIERELFAPQEEACATTSTTPQA